MVLEKVKPANPLDAALSRAMQSEAPEALDAVRPHLPPAMAQACDHILGKTLPADDIRDAGRSLAGIGLVASALAVFKLYARAIPLPIDRATAYRDIVSLETALGMPLAAAAHERVIRRILGVDNSCDSLADLGDGALSVAAVFADRERYEALLGSIQPPALADDPLRDPYFTKPYFMTNQQNTIGNGGAEDYSFFVVDDDENPILLVECDVLGSRELACRDAGIEMTILQPPSEALEAAKSLAFRQLRLIAAWSGAPGFFLEIPVGDPPPRVDEVLVMVKSPFRCGWVDLDQDVAAIERGYRASTRQRIRWGRENVRVFTHRDDVDIPAIYADIHATIGRIPAFPLDQLKEYIRNGRISAFVGYYQDAPCSLVLTTRHGLTTYDWVTARLPLGNLPLSHILVHRAILDAKEQGQRQFDFGPLWESGQRGDKEKSIAEFKSGFASSFKHRISYLVTDEAG